jgi:hypothetical protein
MVQEVARNRGKRSLFTAGWIPLIGKQCESDYRYEGHAMLQGKKG